MTRATEVNDEFAMDVNEFDTLEELKADIRATGAPKEHRLRTPLKTQLLDQLAEGVKGEIPQAMFENRIDEKSVRGFEQRLRAQGLNLEHILIIRERIWKASETPSASRLKSR